MECLYLVKYFPPFEADYCTMTIILPLMNTNEYLDSKASVCGNLLPWSAFVWYYAGHPVMLDAAGNRSPDVSPAALEAV